MSELEQHKEGVRLAAILADHDAPYRERIQRLEAEMRLLPQVELPVKHTFANGMYAREIFIPKGVTLVGKIHRHEHLNTVIGNVTVSSEFADMHIEGVQTFASEPGTKRAIVAHTDSVWICYHLNHDNETDPDKLEATMIAPDYNCLALDAPNEMIKLKEG